MIRVISVQGHWGSVAGGLGQGPPLRVLDAPNQCGWLDDRQRRDILQTTPQCTSWRMVPSVARLILVYYEIQSSSYQPILLPKFEEDFHYYLMGQFQSSQNFPASYRLDHLRLTSTHSSTPICTCGLSWYISGISQRLALLRRFVFRTIIYGVLLLDPAVRRSGKPFGSPSPPPYLAHRTPST